jgi:DNA-binding response OmpR family regulator
VVEDDLRLAELVLRYLQGNGFRVTAVAHGDHAIRQVQRESPDLIILDLGLPGRDGFSICKELRLLCSNPILILTARDNDSDHVLGLEYGADDYVIKPVEPRVLMARIHALLRRSRSAAAETGTLCFGRLQINARARTVHLEGRSIALSGAEFELLAHLAAHAGQVQSRKALYQRLCHREYDGADRTLDIRMSNLRRKLGEDAEKSERIKTIWGRGYLFTLDGW